MCQTLVVSPLVPTTLQPLKDDTQFDDALMKVSEIIRNEDPHSTCVASSSTSAGHSETIDAEATAITAVQNPLPDIPDFIPRSSDISKASLGKLRGLEITPSSPGEKRCSNSLEIPTAKL